ncbi:MAG: MFS transporter [Candidatus Omnitrophica bacterium]|nr:MFS transporter [Candidatus Omnitrophota bacterium]
MVNIKDRLLISASAGLRAAAVGLSGVIIAIHLSAMGWNVPLIGLLISIGLIGAAMGTLVILFVSKHLPKRLVLVALSLFMVGGGLAFAFSRNISLLVVSAFFGMVNGMGRDKGPAGAIEQAILPRTAPDTGRTKVFAWYNATIDAGHALGALLGGLPALFRLGAGAGRLASYEWTWLVYAFLCFLSGLLVLGLSSAMDPDGVETPGIPASGHSRPVIRRFALLSGLDSLGGGFLTTALVGFWFFKRFGADESLLGPLFFFARAANMLSHFGAAWIARRIGLLNTMVFTHVPSSLLLLTIPFMPNLTVAVILFVLRESLVEMDVPTRQSYLMAIVKPHERVGAAAATNLTRGVAWGVAPMIAGRLGAVSLSLPILIGPAIKIVYDFWLYFEFRKIKPPEE